MDVGSHLVTEGGGTHLDVGYHDIPDEAIVESGLTLDGSMPGLMSYNDVSTHRDRALTKPNESRSSRESVIPSKAPRHGRVSIAQLSVNTHAIDTLTYAWQPFEEKIRKESPRSRELNPSSVDTHSILNLGHGLQQVAWDPLPAWEHILEEHRERWER